MVKHIRINPDFFLLLENTFSRTIHFHGSIVVEGFFTLAFLKIRQKMNDLLQNTCFSIHHQQRKLPSAHSCWNETHIHSTHPTRFAGATYSKALTK